MKEIKVIRRLMIANVAKSKLPLQVKLDWNRDPVNITTSTSLFTRSNLFQMAGKVTSIPNEPRRRVVSILF